MFEIFDTRNSLLGEGPLWHPLRQQLFWFDILKKRLLSKLDNEELSWQFDEQVSSAGWIDKNNLLIASESQLFVFDLRDGSSKHLVELEACDLTTRSNDGRSDPWGGFWISTMSKSAEIGRGSIYRFYRGKVYKIFENLTIPNAICFSPGGGYLYYTDTVKRIIFRQVLDAEGWPKGVSEEFIDLRDGEFNPDGAVVDQDGYLWNAHWGAGQICRFTNDGVVDIVFSVPVRQPSCIAFGGIHMEEIYVTSASVDLTEFTSSRVEGYVYRAKTTFKGLTEYPINIS